MCGHPTSAAFEAESDASLLDNRSDLSVRFGCVTMKRSAEQIYV